jgi:hypothetical protein
MSSPRFVYGEGNMTVLCENGGLQRYRGVRSVTWKDFYAGVRRILVVRCGYEVKNLALLGVGVYFAFLWASSLTSRTPTIMPELLDAPYPEDIIIRLNLVMLVISC